MPSRAGFFVVFIFYWRHWGDILVFYVRTLGLVGACCTHAQSLHTAFFVVAFGFPSSLQELAVPALSPKCFVLGSTSLEKPSPLLRYGSHAW